MGYIQQANNNSELFSKYSPRDIISLIENLGFGMLWVQKFLTQNRYYTAEKEKSIIK
jgi:hypothetical protein